MCVDESGLAKDEPVLVVPVKAWIQSGEWKELVGIIGIC